jgi:predicted MPP superfamily phosphohydrolase
MPIARRILVVLAAALFLLGLHMLLLGSAPPRLRVLQINIASWPVGVRPLRILLFSDFHVATPGDTPARLEETVRRANALDPDIVLLAGDFLSTGTIGVHALGPGHSVAPLAGLRPRLGSFAVLGNHDYSHPRKVGRSLKALGIRLLDNDSARVGPLAVIGISDAASHHDDEPKAFEAWRRTGGVPIVFTHSPDIIPTLPSQFRLVLAGHTHCGQISFPFIGPLVTQSRFAGRYACGIVREHNRISVITAGLGTSGLPMRLGAPPDMWLISVGPSQNTPN